MLEEDSREASGWEPLTRAALCPHPVLSLAFLFKGKNGEGELCHLQKLGVGWKAQIHKPRGIPIPLLLRSPKRPPTHHQTPHLAHTHAHTHNIL